MKKSELLNEELKNIQFSEIAGKNTSAKNVTLDLDLFDGRNTVLGYADVSWKSSAPEIVSPSGYVECPKEPTNVTVTAIFTYQDYPEVRAERSFELTVQKGENRVEAELDKSKIRIFIAGDSTACNYPHEGEGNRYPQTGWGQVFGELFNDEALVVNCARSGRSSKSFLTEDNFKYICDNIQKGDYIFIQFAHNDCKKEDSARYTSPEDGTYRECIYKFIDAARRAGAEPVLCTSITRNLPDDNTLVPYADALKAIGAEDNIPVLDMYAVSHASLLEKGAEKSAELHMHVAPRDERFADNPEFVRSQYYESGSRDNTHLNINGARVIAKIAADELRRINHPLAKYLK